MKLQQFIIIVTAVAIVNQPFWIFCGNHWYGLFSDILKNKSRVAVNSKHKSTSQMFLSSRIFWKAIWFINYVLSFEASSCIQMSFFLNSHKPSRTNKSNKTNKAKVYQTVLLGNFNPNSTVWWTFICFVFYLESQLKFQKLLQRKTLLPVKLKCICSQSLHANPWNRRLTSHTDITRKVLAVFMMVFLMSPFWLKVMKGIAWGEQKLMATSWLFYTLAQLVTLSHPYFDAQIWDNLFTSFPWGVGEIPRNQGIFIYLNKKLRDVFQHFVF